MAPEESAEAADLLRSFERRFLAARALRSFPWQGLEEKLKGPLGSKVLLDILQKTVRHPVCVRHPPSVKYRRSFLSELIRRHEAVQPEPLDELYEALAEVLMAQEAPPCHRSYLLGTTGLVTWTAALYLAEWALDNPDTFAHRTVLELGSGAGLTGLAICKGCRPRAYVFSDGHSRVLEQLRDNVVLNGLTPQADPADPDPCDTQRPQVAVAQLDWDLVTGPQLAAFQPDVVIAADVLYCPETTRSLVGALQRLAGCQGHLRAPDAYVAFTARNLDTWRLFTEELGRAGIPWEKLPRHSRRLFAYDEETVETSILKLTLAAPSHAGGPPGDHPPQDGMSLDTHGVSQTCE
ncbi:protein-lysine N-methyltransferase EEF2KMT isoform X2 [Sorex araneus]|uniref:protein-lysine N-methyltransferase EEF2KMT isoform X2 n=1 Tax=Sorex araneus TaxID=42254 RepID=UPI002433FD98|nr:protein-lysine N-methyltransferase EEF2KMT isoform X2 [Sorex araneus]